MGTVISLLNHKGGVGKTTSAINIGAGMAELGKKVLLIDLDPQANLTLALTEMTFDEIENQTCFFEIMFENKSFNSAVLKTKFSHIDLLPSTSVNSLLNQTKDLQLIPRAQRLLNFLKMQYDYIVFDCNPTASVSHAVAVLNSDIVLSPILMDAYSIHGLNKTIVDVKDMCRQFGHAIKHRVLFNKVAHDPTAVEKTNQVREILPQHSWLASFSQWDLDAEDQTVVSHVMNRELNKVYEFLLEEKTTPRRAAHNE